MGATGSIPEQYTEPKGEGLLPLAGVPALKLGKNNVITTLQKGLEKHGLKVIPNPRKKVAAMEQEAHMKIVESARGGKRTQKNKKKVKFSRKTNSVRKL
jgi:hypothetical protein